MRIRVLRADGTPAAGSTVVVTRAHPSGHDLAYRTTGEIDAEGWTTVAITAPESAVSVRSPGGETYGIDLPAGLRGADEQTRQLLIRLHR